MIQARPVPLRRQQRDFTRQRLVDAARELFLSNGTRATSIDDIAKAAGTSRATFYAHFTDKQDVLRELARGMYETAFAIYHKFTELEAWTHETIDRWMREVFVAWEENADATGVVLQEMPNELQADFLMQHRRRVDALTSGSLLWERFEKDEAHRRASMLLFQLERTMVAQHYGGWGQDYDALRGTLVDIWVATLNGPTSPTG